MIHFIPYVNNFALLEKSYNSCRDFSRPVIIIDNRDINSLEEDPVKLNVSEGHYHYKPPVPLTTAQTMNWMWLIARKVNAPFFTWQHADASYELESIIKLYEVAKNCANISWGVIHTHYDVLCAYNTEAITAIGGWDYLRFPWYFLDNDLHIRLEKSGFRLVQANVGTIHHNHSSTIRSSNERRIVNDAIFPVSESLFKRKHPDFGQYGSNYLEV